MKLTEEPRSLIILRFCLWCFTWLHFHVCFSSSLVQPRWYGAQREGGSDCQLLRRVQPLLCCSTKAFHKLSKQVSIPQPLPVSVQINRYKDEAHTPRAKNNTESGKTGEDEWRGASSNTQKYIKWKYVLLRRCCGLERASYLAQNCSALLPLSFLCDWTLDVWQKFKGRGS